MGAAQVSVGFIITFVLPLAGKFPVVHDGGAEGVVQDMTAAQPLPNIEPSELNTKVKAPVGWVEVNGPGTVAPEKVPSKGLVLLGPL